MTKFSSNLKGLVVLVIAQRKRNFSELDRTSLLPNVLSWRIGE